VLTTAVKRKRRARERAAPTAIRSDDDAEPRLPPKAMNAAGATPPPTSRASACSAISATCCARSRRPAGTPIGAKLSYAAVPVFDQGDGLPEGRPRAPAAPSAISNTPRPTRASPTALTEPQRLLLADCADARAVS
jgi:hypothetical protein